MESRVQEKITIVIGLLLTAAFTFKMATDTGYLTPEKRIGLAILCGIGLIGFGLNLTRNGQRFAWLVPGSGAILLYLTAIVAHRWYALIPFEAAVAIAGSICGLCVWLQARTKNDFYLLIGAAGAYGAPLLLTPASPGVFALYYLALCSIAFIMISIWLRSRLLITALPFMAVLATASSGFALNQDNLSATLLGTQFVLFGCGLFLFVRETGLKFSARESWVFLPAALAFYATESQFLFRINPSYVLWAAGVLATLLGLLYWRMRNWFAGAQSLLSFLITLIAATALYLGILPAHLRPWVFIVIMVLSALVPARYLLPRPGSIIRAPFVVLGAILVIEYVNMVFRLLTEETTPQLLVISLAAYCSIGLALLRFRKRFPSQESLAHLLLGAAHLLAIVALYRSVNVFGPMAVSIAWLLYSVAALVLAFLRRDETLAKSALVVLCFIVAKGLLYDSAAVSMSIRIASLFLTGAALYGSGFLVKKMAEWK